MHSLSILVGVLCGLSVATTPVPSTDDSLSTTLVDRDTPCANGLTKGLVGRSYDISCNADTSVSASSHRHFDSGSWRQCMQVCDGTPGCSGWTWTPAESDGGTCWFKKGKTWSYDSTTGYVAGILPGGSSDTTGHGQSNAGTTSSTTCKDALVSDKNGRFYNIKCGSDTSISASSSKTYDSASYYQCIRDCGAISGCIGWTWVPKGLGGTCWFKKSKDVVFYDASAGYVAGILTDRPSTATKSPDPQRTTEQSTTDATTTTQQKPFNTKAPAKSAPLHCGVSWQKAGYAFWACYGRLAIWDYCSLQTLSPTKVASNQYYSLDTQNGGILVTREQYPPGDARCDPSSMPPPPHNCGPQCDPQCYSNLATIMNNCQTNTVTQKMGGQLLIGCDMWGIESVSVSAGSNANQSDWTVNGFDQICQGNANGGQKFLHRPS